MSARSSSRPSRNTSSRQVGANRRNARRSTGPRTVAGKRRSSRNATSHGIYCRDLVLPGESNEEFQAYRDSLLMRLNPQDVLELMIVDRIVAASWKLRRLQAAEPHIHHVEAAVMRQKEHRHQREIEEQLIEHERIMGGDPRKIEALLEEADALPPRQRFPVAMTLAISLVRGDSAFERVTRIEQRLERSIHRNVEELRKLRKLNDEVSSLRPSLRPCPFLSESAKEFDVEPEAGPEVEESAECATADVQNEPMADSASKEQSADARQDRAEYGPTPRSAEQIVGPRVENPCHKEGPPTASGGSSQAVAILDPAPRGPVPLETER